MNDASELIYARDLIDEEVQKSRLLPSNRKLFEPFQGIARLADPFEFEWGTNLLLRASANGTSYSRSGEVTGQLTVCR